MTLLEPYWLLLAIPIGVALCLWLPSSRLQRVLRVSTIVLVLLSLAGLELHLKSRAGTVIVVTDRSASMPADSEARQKEMIDLVQKGMGASDLLGVVSFGETAGVERLPAPGRFTQFQREAGRNASDLAGGLEKALALLPEGTPGRILVLSDGRWTGRDPGGPAAHAASRRIGIDYRVQERQRAGDLAIESLEAPAGVAPGESFLITAWVRSPSPREVTYELRDRNRLIASGKQQMPGGRNRLTFRALAREGGNHAYTLSVSGVADDPVPGNNTAKLLVGVSGPKPLLHITRAANSGLAALLKKGGLDVRVKAPADCRLTLEDLARYSAVVLENVPAEQLKHHGMETIAAWVRETGAGLFMTGGRESFGPGGYHKSPIDPILPVSLELRNEHRKLKVAIVVALDRSGSMAAPAEGGRVKMDLANAGTAAVLELLGPSDEFGCIAVDTAPHTIRALSPVTDRAAAIAKIKTIRSQGGGIYIHEALKEAAAMIAPAQAGTKHIILFSDAADSEEPGDYKALLEKVTRAGITVSVIGLGKPSDPDGQLLEDIAKRGNGRCFFTEKAEELPRLFVEDTFVVARNTFLDEPTRVREQAGLALLTGKKLGLELTLGGYNLCYLKPDANQGGVTLDEYGAPVVASWQAGTGRVVCYMGEADGKYAGELPRWERAGDFYTSLARWTAGLQGPLSDRMLPRLEVRNGVALIELHLDPDRKKEAFSGVPQVTILKAEPGQTPRPEKRAMRWSGPDLLTVEVPLRGAETALTTIEVPGQHPVQLPPACLPYSPELRPEGGEGGAEALEKLGRATRGRERIELAGIWQDLPQKPRSFPLTPWMLSLAVILLVVEVFERRTELLSRLRLPSRSSQEDRAKRRRWFRRRGPPLAPREITKALQGPPPPVASAKVEDGLINALKKAKERTRGWLD